MIVGIGNTNGYSSRHPVEIVEPYTANDFSLFLDLLDNLFDAIATRRLDEASDLDRRQVIGWLKDIRVTTSEMIAVLEEK